MRTPPRRRGYAVIAVVAAITGSAYAQLVVTSPTSSTNGSIPQSTAGSIIFSIRNTSTAAINITSLTPDGGAGCTGVSVSRIDSFGMQGVMLAPGQQQQYVASTSTGFSTSPADCTWTVNTSQAITASVTTEFLTDALMPGSANVQPTVANFGSQYPTTFEIQHFQVTNYGGSGAPALAQITNDPTAKFSFVGSCSGHDCFVGLPPSPSAATLDVRCQAGAMGDTNTATLTVYDNTLMMMGSGTVAFGATPMGGTLGTSTLYCDAYGNGIQIDNPPVPITTPLNMTGSGVASISSPSGSGSMMGAMLQLGTNLSFRFLDSDCSTTTCDFSGSPRTLPTTLTIQCQGSATQTNATLTVYSGAGSGQSDSATVTCTSVGSPGILSASPNPVDFMTQDVNVSGTKTLTLTNSGGSDITNVVVTPSPTNASDWMLSNPCTASTPCTLSAGSGALGIDIPVTFDPSDIFDRSSSVTVSGNGVAPVPVGLHGIGQGSLLSVTAPPGPPYALDFGTIPKGQAFTRTLTLSDLGNKTLNATVDGVTAPYSITPAGTVPVQLGMPRDFTVTCQSATPSSSSNDQTITVATDAIRNGTATVDVKCKIADTSIQVDPQQFDFGEVRTGTPTGMLTVTVSNPATSPAHITSMQLREPRTGLTLVPPMTDIVLQPGDSTTATLQLTTLVDSDLDGEFLDINVDSAMLSLPVTGKVVTAHSKIVPPQSPQPQPLDLGTACVGSTATGQVMLINDGTATLQVGPPQMDMNFLAAGPSGTTYPATLAAGNTMMASVSPAMSTTGPIAGTLTWHDDVPNDYMVPVKLEYITTGTAISPAVMNFGSIAVDTAAYPQYVTIENCDLDTTSVTIKAITTTNSPVGAWVLEPRLGYTKTLGAHEKQAITVTFRPPARGRYEADLEVETSIGKKRIHLVGDATGRDFDNTSFYACACETPSSPAHGWPIALAVVVIIVRRRRGSSSAH